MNDGLRAMDLFSPYSPVAVCREKAESCGTDGLYPFSASQNPGRGYPAGLCKGTGGKVRERGNKKACRRACKGETKTEKQERRDEGL